MIFAFSPPWPMYQHAPDHNAVVSANHSARWSHKFSAKINGGLALSGSVLYVESFDGRVSALDGRSGALLWSIDAGRVVMTTPVVADGLVVVGTGTNAVIAQSRTHLVWGSPQGDEVVAYDSRTGKRRWTYHTVGENMPAPAIAHIGSRDAIVFANGDDHVRALDLQSGRLIWQTPVQGIDSMGSIAVDGGVAFVPAGGAAYSVISDHVYAISATTGRVLWRARYGNSDCSPTVADHRVFVEGSATDSSRPANLDAFNDVAALDEGTGKLRWRWYSGYGAFTSAGSDEEAIAGMAAGGTLYQSLPAASEFAAFDERSGRLLWKIHTRAAVKMSAVEQAGRVYFGDTSGELYVVDAASGRVLVGKKFPHIFTTSSPIIAGGTLYISNRDTVYAVPLSSLSAT